MGGFFFLSCPFFFVADHMKDREEELIFCKDRNTGYNLRKNDTQDLVPNFSRTDGFKYSFF